MAENREQMSKTPKSDEALREGWPIFIEAVFGRMDKGRVDYGDASFERPVTDIIEELQQECLDQAGWGFIGWWRLELQKRRYASVCCASIPAQPPTTSETGS
jgi:hypothetical protein